MILPEYIIVLIGVIGLIAIYFMRQPIIKVILISAVSIIYLGQMYILIKLAMQYRELREYLLNSPVSAKIIDNAAEVNREVANRFFDSFSSIISHQEKYLHSFNFDFISLMAFLVIMPFVFIFSRKQERSQVSP